MKYKVSIPKKQKVELFEKKRDNIALFYAQDLSGNRIAEPCKIELSMSKSAMLELGKELIHDALQYDWDVSHFYKASLDSGIMQTLGVFLHPNSVEPIIISDEEPSIDNILKNK